MGILRRRTTPEAPSPPAPDPVEPGIESDASPAPTEPEGAAAAPPEASGEPEPVVLELTRTSIEQRARDHLAAVVMALEAAGIEHWHVPSPQRPSRTRVGTFAPSAQVLAALSGLGDAWTIEAWDDRAREWIAAERGGADSAGPGALRLYTTVWDPGRNRRIAVISAVEVETWRREGEYLVAALPHVRGTWIPADDPRTEPSDVRGQLLWTWTSLTVTEPTELAEPIDAVVTWVDSSDPVYAAARRPWLVEAGRLDPLAGAEARTRSLDELRYALRSLDMYAPWLRRVWLLTDLQRPDWLDETALTVVDHRELLDGHAALPTFNSHAIESGLHRLDGLAEHFLYVNDDTMLGARTQPGDFFTPTGYPVFQPSGEFLPPGPAAPDEAAPGIAGRSVRALLERDFGRTVTHKLRHTPHPLTRGLLAEVAERYPDEWRRTAGNRFRSADDIAPIQLTLWYALCAGRAATGQPSYAYVELSEVADPAELAAMAAQLRRSSFFCLNLRADPVLPWDTLGEATNELLGDLFPFTSRFER